MHRVRVKICGIRSLEDALHSIACGADALGFQLYEDSLRYVSTALINEVRAQVPPFVALVGLLVNPTRKYTEQILSQTELDLLQFHGTESDEFCRLFPKPFIKAIRVKSGMDLGVEIRKYPNSKGILLDTYQKGVAGGTGSSFDWTLIPDDPGKPVVLAGGLNPQNVVAAIRQVQPYAVDVSSGVESSAGVKDPRRIKNFIEAVHSEIA